MDLSGTVWKWPVWEMVCLEGNGLSGGEGNGLSGRKMACPGETGLLWEWSCLELTLWDGSRFFFVVSEVRSVAGWKQRSKKKKDTRFELADKTRIVQNFPEKQKLSVQ
jgi:hypothetical protein